MKNVLENNTTREWNCASNEERLSKHFIWIVDQHRKLQLDIDEEKKNEIVSTISFSTTPIGSGTLYRFKKKNEIVSTLSFSTTQIGSGTLYRFQKKRLIGSLNRNLDRTSVWKVIVFEPKKKSKSERGSEIVWRTSILSYRKSVKKKVRSKLRNRFRLLTSKVEL